MMPVISPLLLQELNGKRLSPTPRPLFSPSRADSENIKRLDGVHTHAVETLEGLIQWIEFIQQRTRAGCLCPPNT